MIFQNIFMKRYLLFLTISVLVLFTEAQTPSETYTVIDEMTLNTHSINGADFPSAIASYKGAIYYGYIDPDLNGCIAKKDSEGNITTNIVRRGMKADDNHNEVSIAIDTEGYIHWTGDMHHNKMVYYCSENPADITSFNNFGGDVEKGGIRGPFAVSYGRFVQSRKGTLFYLSRQRINTINEGWIPGIMGGNIQRFNINSRRWEELGSLNWDIIGSDHHIYGGMDDKPAHNTKVVFWDNSGAGTPPLNAYQGYKTRVVFDKNNRMHLVWNVAKNPKNPSISNSHTHLMYACSDDEGDTWKNSAGQRLELPITTENGEVAFMMDPRADDLGMYNFCNIMLTSENNPVLLQQNNAIHKVMAFKHNGSGWDEVSYTWKPAWPGEGFIDDNGWMTVIGPKGSGNRRSNDNGKTWKKYPGFKQNSGALSLDYQYLLETGQTRFQYQKGTTAKVKTLIWENSEPGQVALPEITPLSGTTFDGKASVTINCPTSEAEIHYAIGGAIPGETDGTLYEGAFEYNFNGEAIIKAIAYLPEKTPSRIAVSRFTIENGENDNESPGVPQNLNASDMDYNRFTLNWDASADNAGINKYIVFVDDEFFGETNKNSYNISGLLCNESYSVTVAAVDAAGNESGKSENLAVETSACDSEAPSVPNGLLLNEVDETSMSIVWGSSTDNIGVSSYDIFMDDKYAAKTRDTTITLTGLRCGTSYMITVMAKDAQGNISEKSDSLVVQTSECVEPPCSNGPISWTNTAITAQTGALTVEYDLIAGSNNMDGVTGLSSGPAGKFNDMACIVRFNKIGNIDVRNGDDYTSDVEFPYDAAKIYKVRMEINVETHTYDVFITFDGIESKIAEQYAFRTAQASVEQLDNFSITTVTSCLIVENLTVNGETITHVPRNESIQAFSVYPNPVVENQITVAFQKDNIPKGSILSVIDMNGKTLIKKETGNIDKLIIPVEMFDTGIYLINLQTRDNIYIEKLILNKQ